MGIASKKAGENTSAFLKTISKKNLLNGLLIKSSRAKFYANYFVDFLDMAALDNGKKIWLEKTPQHLYYIRPIEKYIKNVKFIHVLRNGEDVVASLYEVTHKYPEIWDGPRTIDQCIERWIEDVKISFKYISHENHMRIKYEELVDDPSKIIRKACDFIGVKFHQEMLKKYSAIASEVLLKVENWKEEVKGSILNNNGKKFFKVFNPQEREYISKLIRNSASHTFYQNM
jgi:hypothetical protein